MNKMKTLVTALIAIAVLSACKTTEPLYYYGDYPEAVYSYFNANDTTVSEQIAILENVIEQAGARGKPVAPGVHAHLGMLYFESGNASMGQSNFEQEKALFPESSTYIDFLMTNLAGAK